MDGQVGLCQLNKILIHDRHHWVVYSRLNLFCFFHYYSCSTFDFAGRLTNQAAGPIKNTTIVKLDAGTGSIIERWGEKMFYMPHGLEIDANGNTWVTDVAMHQVFKVQFYHFI